MDDKPPAFLAPAVVLLAVSAVIFAGIGGLVSGGTGQKLCAAGAGFCLMMLFVPWIFLSAKGLLTGADMGLAVAFGALGGLCYGLCFAADAGLPGLVGECSRRRGGRVHGLLGLAVEENVRLAWRRRLSPCLPNLLAVPDTAWVD